MTKLYNSTIACRAGYAVHPEMCLECEQAQEYYERRHHCEWCENLGIYRLQSWREAAYQRYACSEHLLKTRRLTQLDGRVGEIKETKRHRGWVIRSVLV